MADYVTMAATAATTQGTLPLAVQSASAAASLSMSDVNFDGVKHHDMNKVSTGNQFLTFLIGIAAVLGVAASLFAMWWEASLYVYIAFAFPLFTGPYILVQRRKLQWLPTFREEANILRLSVNELAAKRAQLGIENGRLERQVKRMSVVEERFEQLVQREGKDIEAFRQLVREGAAIQQEMKKNQASRELLDLFSIILKADKNEDNTVGDNEVEEFILRVKVFAGRQGKLLNEDMIRDAFRSSLNTRTNASMFNVVQSALSSEEPEPATQSSSYFFGLWSQTETQVTPSPAPASTADVEMAVTPDTAATATNDNNNNNGGSTAADDDFIVLQKIPRVGATGLVLSDNMQEEGNAANPIRVENMTPLGRERMRMNQMESGVATSAPKNGGEPDESKDIVAMILNSFGGGGGKS